MPSLALATFQNDNLEKIKRNETRLAAFRQAVTHPSLTNYNSVSKLPAEMELIAGKRKVGSFVNIWHGIAGEVFALDDQTILIEDFTYDGQVEY